MARWSLVAFPALVLLAALPAPVPACSFCNGNLQQKLTFRQEAAQPSARLILLGTCMKSVLKREDGTGETTFRISAVLRSDPAMKKQKGDDVLLPRYLPVDEKDPPRYLLFCDILDKGLDPYRGDRIRSNDAAEYVKKAIALDPKDAVGNLAFFFRYLENADREIARDAFLEFAKATDAEIGRAARKLSPDKLRGWIKDPNTPPERLSVYALLLGACGAEADATFLGGLLKETGERITGAYDGILGGYMHLRPRDGWEQALAILGDGRKPLPLRLAVVRTLRFYHGWQPRESRANVLKGLGTMIAQGDLADLAVEDLRRWGMWDLTREVLALYGRKGYDSPLMQRAIIRYALCCKGNNAALNFVAERRRADAEVVKEVEESLEFERK